MLILAERSGTVIPAELRDLRPSSVALFLDLDGTLIDLADHPDEVVIPPSLGALLTQAQRACGGALALVSGRPIATLDRLLTPLTLRAAGIHGAEIRRSPGGPCENLACDRLPPECWLALQILLEGFPPSFAENKRVSFAIHYPEDYADEAALAAALGDLMARWSSLDLELVQSRRVFEIKCRGFDKGRAIDRFMAEWPFAGRVPIFVADDRVDWPGFTTVLARGGIALSVGVAMPGLSGAFSGPTAVRNWLAGFCG